MKAQGSTPKDMIPAKNNLIFHLIGIIIFLTFPLLFVPRPEGVPLFNLTIPAIRDLVAGSLMIVFFYSNYYFFVPSLILKRKYVLYILIVLIAFAAIIILPSLLTGKFHPSSPPPPNINIETPRKLAQNSFFLSISHNILLFLSVVAFSIFLRVQERLFKIEKAKNQMEILSLKEQINPHFLFNILNNIYGQAIEDNSQKTASSILKLSDMLRHVVHDAQHQWVSLKKELSYLDSYIQLQLQRLGESVELIYLIKGSYSSSLRIAPLILIPFIENAFKHGINPDQKSKIEIIISLEEKFLNLSVKNSKANVRLNENEKSGAGLNITLNRLNILYHDKYNLKINDFRDSYQIELKLELDD